MNTEWKQRLAVRYNEKKLMIYRMKNISFIMLFLFVDFAYSLDTLGYAEIVEVKAWESTIEVYLSGAQQHQCENQAHPGRFLMDPASNHKMSVVLSAFMAGKKVSLSYVCNTEGHPEIAGIRVR